MAVGPSERQRSSSVYSNTKPCVVFRSWVFDRFRLDEYQIYIVDPNSSSGDGDNNRYTHIKPNIRFTGSFPALALCGLDSILYLFEGDDLEGSRPRTYSGKFQITTEILTKRNHLLQNHELAPIKPMHRKKTRPIALPTPDGDKILVFSSVIDYSCGPIPTFELYHVAGNEWELLPPLPSPADHCNHIQSYGFKTESSFVVELMYEMFVIDLSVTVTGPWRKNWKHLDRPYEIPRSCSDYFIWLDDGLFSTWNGYVCDTSSDCDFHVPLSPLPPYESKNCRDWARRFPPSIAPLAPHQNGIPKTCVAKAEMRQDICRLVMDIYSANTQKYKTQVETKKIKQPLLDVRVIKTLKFLIHLDLRTYFSAEMNLYSI